MASSAPVSELGINLDAIPTEIVASIQAQEATSQYNVTTVVFDHLVAQAARPKTVSGGSCVRLCGFVEQASKVKDGPIQEWAFSQETLLTLFNFYTEWDESDHHRSMRLVLDAIAHLLLRNPDKAKSRDIKILVLNNLTSIILGQSAKPVGKSALKTLDHLLIKGVLSLDDVRDSYTERRRGQNWGDSLQIWQSFVGILFKWMAQRFVCPTAAKTILTVSRLLREQVQNGVTSFSLKTWHSWLLSALEEDPSLLDGMKNYVFLPFFKDNRAEAIAYITYLGEQELLVDSSEMELDSPALLHFAALETGKKVGLVEEPDTPENQQSQDSKCSLFIDIKALESALAHPAQDVRALAFSLLITSPATTKPYSALAVDLLRTHLPSAFADADAKFRVDFFGKCREMFRRVRGTILTLKRSIPRARAKARKAKEAAVKHSQDIPQPILYRTNLISLPEPQLVACLDYHEKFLKWYIHFLCNELIPTASYQRHITSLKNLLYVLKAESDATKPWATEDDQVLFFDLFDAAWSRALQDLVLDPFDDVSDSATNALRWLWSDRRYRRFGLDGKYTSMGSPVSEVRALSAKADALARRTGRADHSSGASRTFQLLFRLSATEDQRLDLLQQLLEQLHCKLDMAESNLRQAVQQSPLHGDFASLCLAWGVVSAMKLSETELAGLKILQESAVSSCERAWFAVRGILCDDSPEGHLPHDLEEYESVGTKDILSFSFRAVHESSNLLKVLASTLKNRSRAGFIGLTPELFERAGNLTFTQLSTLRHRGAFSTVSLTFATCCQQTVHLDSEGGKPSLLKSWYEGTMQTIYAQASTTRRSAGIPSLMTGILSANAPGLGLDDVLDKLTAIASNRATQSETDGSQLPQVHAFNCLREIFRSSLLTTLGDQAQNHLPECLELAATGLRSEVWAIRNCGLLFLRSLIDCLFGCHESKAMIEAGWDGKANRVRYHRYPNLPNVLVNLISSGHQIFFATEASSAAESVFPALDIIRRAGPPDVLREELQVHIAKYLASPVWHVREMASRTLCSCLLHDMWLDTIHDLCSAAVASGAKQRNNHAHGVLLTVKFVFERLTEVSPDRLGENLAQFCEILHRFDVITRFAYCPEVLAAYLEVVNLVWSFQISCSLPLEPFNVSIPTGIETALLRIQKAVNGVYRASQAEDHAASLRHVLLNGGVSVDGMIAALDATRAIWHVPSSSATTLTGLCVLYCEIVQDTESTDARVAAMRNISTGMRLLLQENTNSTMPTSTLRDLWLSFGRCLMSPALADAVIEASGCIMASLRRSDDLKPRDLELWGRMVADAGRDDKTFDSRIAAAESLCAFLSAVDLSTAGPEYTSTLVALYDALNDDDEDVRTVGSAGARAVLGQAILPLEAASKILQWSAARFGSDPGFHDLVADRIVGADKERPRPWVPAGVQLTDALREDDSLFVIEEQNLFVDEARETDRWLSLLSSLLVASEPASTLSTAAGVDPALAHPALAHLDAWVTDGLAETCALAESQHDGPLGWASNPLVFAICSRVLRAAVALERAGVCSAGLGQGLGRLREVVREQGEANLVSSLLMGPLGEEAQS